MSLTLEERKCPACGYEYAIHDDETHTLICIDCGSQFMDEQELKDDFLAQYINQELDEPLQEILKREFDKRGIQTETLELAFASSVIITLYISYRVLSPLRKSLPSLFGEDNEVFKSEYIKSMINSIISKSQVFAQFFSAGDNVLEKNQDEIVDIFNTSIIHDENLLKIVNDKHLDIVAEKYLTGDPLV